MSASPSRYVPPTGILKNRAALSFVDSVVILLTNVEKWSEQDLLTVMEKSLELGGMIENPSVITEYFGEPYGASAAHRKLIVDWQAANNVAPTARVTTLTDSMIMRGALTAYSWMVKTEVKPFKTSELDAACAWITKGQSASPELVKTAVLGCYKILGK